MKARRKTRETPEEKRRRAAAILKRLGKAYPDARCALDFASPLELLVATILSAQCTDVRVNLVTPALFRKYRTAADYARAPRRRARERHPVRPASSTRRRRACARAGAAIAAEHGGKVPDTMEELLALPGVGRKTANVILGNAFGKDEGFVVDTHVGRLARRMGFTRQSGPGQGREGLERARPGGRRTMAAHRSSPTAGPSAPRESRLRGVSGPRPLPRVGVA